MKQKIIVNDQELQPIDTNCWEDIMKRFPNQIPLFDEIYKKKAIQMKLDPIKGVDSMAMTGPGSPISNECRKLLVELFDQGAPGIYEGRLVSEVVGRGPKIFQPKKFDFAMLELMKINVGFLDYVQPFPTVLVELPKDYTINRGVDCPQFMDIEYMLDHMCKPPAKHYPVMAIIHHWAEYNAIICGVILNSGMSIKCCLWETPEIGTIDEAIESAFTIHRRSTTSLEMSDEEDEITRQVLRSTLNYVLLLDEVGIKKVGYRNPDYVSKLQERIKKNNAHSGANRDTLRQLPVYYELNQEVKLYKTVGSHEELGPEEGGSGRTIGPHHRRGHYRMQPYGPQNTLRKRIRVAPVFVNAARFVGQMSDTKVTYKD